MKVLIVNGSPHEKGCTYTALNEAATILNEEGVETEFFWIGLKAISGCIACLKCQDTGVCILDDCVNEFLKLAESADGFLFGSPVHYAAVGGAMTSFMDRSFYSGSRNKKKLFYLKPAAAIISARRAGTTAALDQMNKYFAIAQMPIVTSSYWNMVHGTNPADVAKDLEGMQTMRNLARNMAYTLKCKEAGIKMGVALPEPESGTRTNFIES